MLIVGQESEGVTDAETVLFLEEQVCPAIATGVITITRMGRYSDQVEGDCRMKVDFNTGAQAQAALRAAFQLKALQGIHTV